MSTTIVHCGLGVGPFVTWLLRIASKNILSVFSIKHFAALSEYVNGMRWTNVGEFDEWGPT